MWRLALAGLAGLADATNLALGRVPFGSSEISGAELEKATDGDPLSEWRSRSREPLAKLPTWRLPEPRYGQAPPDTEPRWRLPHFSEMEGDYPGVLVVDLGAASHIDGMQIVSLSTAGFETLRVYRSLDGDVWELVRTSHQQQHCSPGVTSDHRGWSEDTRYVMLEMQQRCAGMHQPGSFAVAEWRVLGRPKLEMVAWLWHSWPRCPDLGPCFAYVDLEQAKSACLANETCDGFSFSARRMMGGRGSGCYKTECRGEPSMDGIFRDEIEVNGSERLLLPPVPLGRGSFGYWAKRRLPPPPEPTRLQWPGPPTEKIG